MTGKDRQEERDESKSQLMLLQLLPKKKKGKNQNRWGKWIKKEPQINVDKLEETENGKEDLGEEKDEERGSKELKKNKKEEMKSMFSYHIFPSLPWENFPEIY